MNSIGLNDASLPGIIIAIISTIGVIVAAWLKANSDNKASAAETWKSFAQEVKAYCDDRIDKLEADLVDHVDYATWLNGLDLPRPPYLSFHEWKNRNQR